MAVQGKRTGTERREEDQSTYLTFAAASWKDEGDEGKKAWERENLLICNSKKAGMT